MKFKPDWFLLGMIFATFLAWAFPNPGAAGGWMHPELVTKMGVALIFFLHGLTLSLAERRERRRDSEQDERDDGDREDEQDGEGRRSPADAEHPRDLSLEIADRRHHAERIHQAAEREDDGEGGDVGAAAESP